MTRRVLALAATLALGVTGPAASGPPLQDEPPITAEDEIVAFVDQALTSFQVPGAAVVAVDRGGTTIVVARGLRCAGGTEPVTGQTSFPIASLTKAFTATVAAMLVAEGDLDWDSRVVDRIPELELSDATATRLATLRDLLAHRTGMGSHDLVWLNVDAGPEWLLPRLKHLEPAAEFRDTAVYSNLMVAVAGEMLGRAAGSRWPSLVRERLLSPLGMTATWAGSPPDGSTDVACPHLVRAGKAMRADPVCSAVVAPAMGLWSTAADMARWLRFLLDEGRVGDSRLVAAAALRETWTPQAAVRLVGGADTPVRTYGLGWTVTSWRGRRTLSHGGGALGFSSQVEVFPDQGVAVAVVANVAESPFTDLVAARAAEILLDLPRRDLLERAQATMARIDAIRAAAAAAVRRSRDPESAPALVPAAYCGRYLHPAFGELEFTRSGEGLQATFHGLVLAVEHLHHDTFLLTHPYVGDLEASFRFTEAGSPEAVTMVLGSPAAERVFTRAPAAAVDGPPASSP